MRKKTRMTIYAVIVVGALAVAGVDGARPDLIADWVDAASNLSGAAAGALALLNLKDDEPADQE